MPPRETVNSDSINTPLAAATQGVDGAVGVSDVKWYVAIVNPRHEKSVVDKLLEINIKSFAATQKEARVWANGKRKIIDRVVIPSLVFIHCTEQKRREIVKQPYILRFMVNRAATPGSLCRPVAVIPDAEIDKLMFMLGQSETPVNFSPQIYKVKDNVRVIRGPFRNLVGEITENSDGTHTLSVGFSILGGATVKIDPHDVEPIAITN